MYHPLRPSFLSEFLLILEGACLGSYVVMGQQASFFRKVYVKQKGSSFPQVSETHRIPHRQAPSPGEKDTRWLTLRAKLTLRY